MSADRGDAAAPDLTALPTTRRGAVLELIGIAAPSVATMTSYTVMQFVDKLMVSRIGPDPIYVGAQGNGGLASFVPIAVAMGFLTVINTYVSQNLGAGRPGRAPAYAWTGLWMAALYWLVLLVPFALLLPSVFALIREDGLSAEALAQVVRRDELATSYGRILLLGAVVTLASRAVAQYFYGMHRASVVMYAALVGNILNVILNSFLIYGPKAPAPTGVAFIDGWFGFTAAACQSLGIPAMGMTGSAIATVIGTAIEFAIPFTLFVSARYQRLYGTRNSWRPSLPHARDITRIGWPGGLMFGNEMLCWAFFMVYLVGKFGEKHSTAGWIAHQWMSLSFMPAVGISIAVTATVGKCLGAKRPDLASNRAWTGLSMALIYMGICGVLFIVLGESMISLFIEPETPPETVALLISLGSKFLIATAAFQLFDAVAMVLSGALRGAGDTVWTGVVTVLLSWSIIVAGGYGMTRFFPQLQSVGPWIAASTYIIVLSLAILLRWMGGRWRTINLLDKHSAAEGPATSALAHVPAEAVDGIITGMVEFAPMTTAIEADRASSSR